jgi:rhodanese-related sulfurtransferase
MVDDLISKDVPIIMVEELQNKTNITFLDTRSSEEYELSHIKNALWVGEKNWDMEAIKNIDKKQTLVVYCSVGYRSEKLVKKILRLKSHKTFNLYGGIFDWINKGKPIENRSGITDSIHGFNQNFARWIKMGIPVY